MKQLRIGLPDKRSWGLLIFVVFIGFLFLRPYQQRAGWLEWTLTAAGVAAFVGLYQGPGAVIVNGTVFVNSGYAYLGSAPGNVLLAFSVEGR